MSLADAIRARYADPARRPQTQVEAKALLGFGQGKRLAHLDELAELSRTAPQAFAEVPAETRYLVGLRAATRTAKDAA